MRLLEALLRKVRGDCATNEALVCIEAFAYDFGRFQDVFIKCDPLEMTLIFRRGGSEVPVSKELDLKCFSPSKPTFDSHSYQGPENHRHGNCARSDGDVVGVKLLNGLGGLGKETKYQTNDRHGFEAVHLCNNVVE
jgi:hypothetical protein